MMSINSKRAVSMAALDSSFDTTLTHDTWMDEYDKCISTQFPRWNLEYSVSNKQISLS